MSLKTYKQKRKKQVLSILSAYAKKREFSKTPEPKGKIKMVKSEKSVFVVHSHFARNHHYDLRLEMDGVLRSWAIPKEPPKTKGVKRLAMQVEDHPVEYAKFRGIIPEGQYGAGKVEIWDKGKYEVKERTGNKIEFTLHGKKLKGNFVLVKTRYGNKPGKSWLFMKV